MRTVIRRPTPCRVRTKPSERADPVSVNVRHPSATMKAVSPSSEIACPVQSSRKSRLANACSTRAREGAALVGGSITERREGRDKLSNTCLVFDPQGDLVATYRKIHLFDVEVGGHTYRESEAEEHGDEAVVADMEGWPVGLTVCYDVRFPELYRILALEGALLATVPAHFTLYTGKDHWHVLLRARAIENQNYVAAAAQIGETIPGKPSYGRSLIADPWGTVVAQAPDEETVISAELDRERLLQVRRNLPSLANRQADAYRWPART